MKTEKKGRLIAVEGTHGPEVVEAAAELARELQEKVRCGVSGWDASNTFFELTFIKGPVAPASIRTLLLLYASDLIFRARWEIRPALDEGRYVVAAPYVETAVAAGVAAGLPFDWLQSLFRFAPKPDFTFRIKEKKKRWHKKLKPADGFVEFLADRLYAPDGVNRATAMRARALEYLDELEEREGIRELKVEKAVDRILRKNQ